jgi:peroxiredoxin
MPLSSSVVPIGTPAPAFALPAAGGQQVALADYRGRRAVALVFLRGFH